MNTALYGAFWCLSFGTLVAGNLFVHRYYTQTMREEIRQFEGGWQQLEKRYGKN